MKKRLSLILALVLIFSLFAPTAVSAASAVATEVEDNNQAALANTFTEGTIRAALSNAKDIDFFKIDTTANDYYTFNFKTSSPTDTTGHGWEITFYDSDMNQLYSTSTKNTFTTPRFCIPGYVYIKVISGSEYDQNTPTCSYDLTYTGYTQDKWENEYNNVSTSANAIATNTVYHGSLLNAKDADWFVVNPMDYFTVTLRKNGQIPTNYSVNHGWEVTVFDSSFEELTTFNTETTATTKKFPVSGPIYIKVSSNSEYDSNSPMHVYYDLKVESSKNAVWEDEYNNSSTTANVIEQGTVYTGNLQSSADVDYFKVKSTTKAIAVNFSIALSEVDADNIRDGWQITVSPANTSKSIATYTINDVGSFKTITLPYEKGAYYYIKVEAASTYRAPVGEPYHISVVDASEGNNWEVERGKNNISNATALTEGATVYGNLYASEDKDYFKCAIVSGGTIKITFNRAESDNADKGYKITVKDAAGNAVKFKNAEGKEVSYGVVDTTTGGTFSAIPVKKGNYYIVVEPNSIYGAPGAEINYSLSYKLTLSKPTAKFASSTTSAIKLSWAKKTDVNGYQIQYATKSDFSDAKTVTAGATSTGATISGTSAAKAYYIRVRTYAKDTHKTHYSPWSSTVIGLNALTVKAVTGTTNTLKVTWAKTAGATSYQVQYATKADFSDAKTQSATTNSYTIKSTSATKVYYVRIRSVMKFGGQTYTSTWSAASVGLNTPAVKSVAGGNKAMTVSFAKTAGVTKYQIQYSTDKTFKNAKVTKTVNVSASATSQTIKSLSASKIYYVRLRTVVTYNGKTYTSAWSAISVGITNTSMSKVAAANKMATVTWTAVSGATGYQIQYAPNKNFSGAENTGLKTGTKATLNKLTSKTTYYVRVRAVFKYDGKTYYSGWSSALSVTAK